MAKYREKFCNTVSFRLPVDVRAHVDDRSEHQPGCSCAAADYQWLDPDAEEGHRRFCIVRSGLDRVP